MENVVLCNNRVHWNWQNNFLDLFLNDFQILGIHKFVTSHARNIPLCYKEQSSQNSLC